MATTDEPPKMAPREVRDPPQESYGRLFLRFLRFGLLAWGGPVAQIAMIRHELVEEERWISRERFNRVLAVYQVLPGPEAHELCVYFGMIARGRLGGLLAGLGFMLPGFLLMLALSWLYVAYGVRAGPFQAAFYGAQAAVCALIVRAIHRIGEHALPGRWLLGLAALSFVAALLGVHFAIALACTGLAYAFVKRGRDAAAVAIGIALLAGAVASAWSREPAAAAAAVAASVSPNAAVRTSLLALLGSGFKAGLLTFGGAYTAVPFIQRDAVVRGGWISNAEFLDGIALSGLLPAPFIIFGTFVGYLGGGPLGALAMTFGIFAPAFAFTLVGHDQVERLVENRAVHSFLDGVTAGVVGLICATTIGLFRSGVVDLRSAAIFAAALAVLYVWKAKAAVAATVIGAGVLGVLLLPR